MGARRTGFGLFFVILAAVLLGSGTASARPAQTHVHPALATLTPLTTPSGHTGGHCRTRRDPVAPDPADV